MWGKRISIHCVCQLVTMYLAFNDLWPTNECLTYSKHKVAAERYGLWFNNIKKKINRWIHGELFYRFGNNMLAIYFIYLFIIVAYSSENVPIVLFIFTLHMILLSLIYVCILHEYCLTLIHVKYFFLHQPIVCWSSWWRCPGVSAWRTRRMMG